MSASPNPFCRSILLVDDHPVVRECLSLRICQEKDLTVCTAVGDAASALSAVEKHHPDLAIVDINLPDMHGLELIKEILALDPKVRLLVFSMHDEQLYGERVLQAGAHGYVSKDEPPEKMIEAIRRVLGGLPAVDQKPCDQSPFQFTTPFIGRNTVPPLAAGGGDRSRLLAEARHDLVVAQEANRAKDDFLATLSHELRVPLNPILLLSSDGAANLDLPESIRADFATIAKNVVLESKLIDDLLDLTRVARRKLKLEKHSLDVHAVLHDAITIISGELESKEIRLDLDLRAERSWLSGDSVRLQQAFWNVLANAVKFTPSAGRIRVTSQLTEDQQRVRITISDSGLGLTPSELACVFNPFAQGEHAAPGGSQRFGGLGLGLALSRMMINMHGGSIRAESEGRNCGATFIVELPLQDSPVDGSSPSAVNDEATSDSSQAPNSREASGGWARILLVEDHEPTRLTLCSLLTRRGFNVLTAGSVKEGLAVAAEGGIDVVISDIGLPDGTGHEMMKTLRDRYGLRGIALSGYGSEADITRSQAAGFISHLTKPVRVECLERALLEACTQRGHESQVNRGSLS